MTRLQKTLHCAFAAFLIQFSSLSFGEIRETASMAEALATVDEQTLLIFDLDNTVMKPSQTLGTDQWFDHLVRQHIAAGRSQDEAINRAIALWSAVQRATTVVPVESTTPNLIKGIQRRGITVMALTARPLDLIDTTTKQLKSIGVDFTRTPVLDRQLELRSDDLAKFAAGIVFVGPKNNKGKVLVQFLQKIGLAPKRIVFVDDKSKHVHNMDEAFKASTTSYIGFRYGATDEEVANFDAGIADVQLRFFNRILDDKSAATLRTTE